MRLIVFGSAHSKRRNQVGWTRPEPLRSILTIVRPDVVIDGESPGGGGDKVAREEAERAGIPRDPCPYNRDMDGPTPAGFHRRNERMDREKRPTHGIGLIVGNVGSPQSSGSAGMARILRARGVPVVIYREDGIDAPSVTIGQGIDSALRLVRGLYRLTPEVAHAGHALRAAWEAERQRADIREVIALVRGAHGEVMKLRGEMPRIGPWLEAADVALRGWT